MTVTSDRTTERTTERSTERTSELTDGGGQAVRVVQGVPRGRLTPEVARHSDFQQSPRGRRGYDAVDVERFRDRVVTELEKAVAERAELHQEIQRLRDYYRLQGVIADRRAYTDRRSQPR